MKINLLIKLLLIIENLEKVFDNESNFILLFIIKLKLLNILILFSLTIYKGKILFLIL